MLTEWHHKKKDANASSNVLQHATVVRRVANKLLAQCQVALILLISSLCIRCCCLVFFVGGFQHGFNFFVNLLCLIHQAVSARVVRTFCCYHLRGVVREWAVSGVLQHLHLGKWICRAVAVA